MIADFDRSRGPFVVHFKGQFASFMDSYQGYGKEVSSFCLLLTEINESFRAGLVLSLSVDSCDLTKVFAVDRK